MSGDVRDLTYILKYVFLKIHEYKIICAFQLSVSPFFLLRPGPNNVLEEKLSVISQYDVKSQKEIPGNFPSILSDLPNSKCRFSQGLTFPVYVITSSGFENLPIYIHLV